MPLLFFCQMDDVLSISETELFLFLLNVPNIIPKAAFILYSAVEHVERS